MSWVASGIFLEVLNTIYLEGPTPLQFFCDTNEMAIYDGIVTTGVYRLVHYTSDLKSNFNITNINK